MGEELLSAGRWGTDAGALSEPTRVGAEAPVRAVGEAVSGREWSGAVSSARESAGEWLDRSVLPPGPEWDRIAEAAVQANAEALACRTLSARERAAVRAACEEVPVVEEEAFVEEDQGF